MVKKTKIPFPLQEVGINLDSQDQFIKSHGVEFEHWVAIPSPVGLKDRGDYRRSDDYDIITSNGMIYKLAGCFTAAIVSNSKSKRPSAGGVVDYSTARLLIPRFYTKKNIDDKEEIHLAPGDRVFIKGKKTLVSNYQRMQYNPGGLDRAQFPVESVQHLIDSQKKEYKFGYHFKIQDGHIKWIDGKDNPGIDVETGKGRIYSMRYKYNAHWYITEIPNEVRVTQGVDENGKTFPERMQYSAIIQREYVYYNQNNDVAEDQGSRKRVRDIEEPKQAIPVPNEYKIKIDKDS
jgi:hypothetical protein